MQIGEQGLAGELWPGDGPGLDGQAITRWLAQWESFGPQRTDSPGERAAAPWLADQAQALGAIARVREYPFEGAVPGASSITFEGRVITGFPMLDGGATGEQGVDGTLGLANSEAEIMVLEAPPGAEYDPALLAARQRPQPRALVVVTRGGAPGLALINAASLVRPLALPVLQVSSADGEALLAGAARGVHARLAVTLRREPAHGRNVLAQLAGARADLPPMAVVTPRSGWWHSTSERAGGLLGWLALIRAMRVNRPARPVVFTANSGHEIGHLGMRAFEAEHPDLLRGAHAWLHLGANLGARGAQLILQSSEADWLAPARAALQAQGLRVAKEVPPGQAPFGEARNIFQAQGRYLSLLATPGPWFHHPDDRFAQSVDLPVLQAILRALPALAAPLAQ